jgi:hypothetical protein
MSERISGGSTSLIDKQAREMTVLAAAVAVSVLACPIVMAVSGQGRIDTPHLPGSNEGDDERTIPDVARKGSVGALDE